MNKLYLMALPLSLISVGAFGAGPSGVAVAPGASHLLLGSLPLVEPNYTARLNIDAPTGFQSIAAAAGSYVEIDAFDNYGGQLGYLHAVSTSLPLTQVLDENFNYDTQTLDVDTFKSVLSTKRYAGDSTYTDDGRPVAFTPALVRTFFDKKSKLEGKTAVLTFDAAHKQGGNSVMLVPTNKLVFLLKKKGSSAATDVLNFGVEMKCFKHATQANGNKGLSEECDSSEFGSYTGDKMGTINRYKMSLIGGKEGFYTNTISFVPYTLSPKNLAARKGPTVGDYEGNLTVTFSVQ